MTATPAARAGASPRTAAGVGATRPGALWAGVSGLALAATLVPAIVTETAGPDSSASAAVVASSFVSHRTEVLVSGALFLVALACAVAFVTAITGLAWQASRERGLVRLAAGSGIVGVALLGVYASSFAAIAASIDELRGDPRLVYAIFRLISAVDDASGVFIALFLAAIATALVRSGRLPRLLGPLALVAAGVRAIGAFDVTTLGGMPFGPFMVAGTVLCVAWLVLAGAALCLGLPRRGPAADGGVAVLPPRR